MIDFTKPHNWIGLAIVILVVGFVYHTGLSRYPAARQVTQAAGF
jgi:hypothetical protein